MPEFSYQAYTFQGEIKSGTLQAENQQQATSVIKSLGLIPHHIQQGVEAPTSWLPGFSSNSNYEFKPHKKLQYFEMLVPLLKSGLSILECHRLLSNVTNDRTFAPFLESVNTALASGISYSGSLAAAKVGFTTTEVARLAVAEKSSDILPTILNMMQNIKQARDFKQNILSAALYPAILLFASLASIAVIVMVLLPNVAPLFDGRENELPFILRISLSIQHAVSRHFPLLLSVLVGAILTLVFTPLGTHLKSLIFDHSLRIPVIKMLEVNRVSRSLGTLLQCGLTLQDTLSETAKVTSRPILQKGLRQTAHSVADGGSFTSALDQLKLFSKTEHHLIALGLTSNTLDQVFLDIAQASADQAQRKTQRFMALLTPLLTLAMGLIVGGLMMSVMQAILSLNRILL